MSKILKVLGAIFLFFLVIFTSLSLFLLIKSKTWESRFHSTIKPEYMVTESMQLEEALNEKIAGYILNQEYTNYISFSPVEIGQAVRGSLSEVSKGSGLNITNIYIEPTEGLWKVCGLARLDKFQKLDAWVCVDVTKDNIQTAQLFVSNLSIQGINVGKIYPSLLTKINSGIAEALVIVNENGFAGRVFENIELLGDELVIKGSLY